MRKLLAACAALATVAASVSLISSSSAGATPKDDPGRGLVYAGLQQDSSTGPCHGGYRMTGSHGQTLCTHGPDPAPAGTDVRQRRGPAATTSATTSGTASAGATVQCYGTGSDGYRVKLIYAHASNVTDRFSQYQASFAQWASDADSVFNYSAGETGGTRHVRFVTDASCNPIVDDVTLSTTGDDTLNNTIYELQSKGYTATNRKYVVWVDANVYCGIAQIYGDDKATQDNLSNGSTSVQGEFARIDNGCWGVSGQSVEAHELMHNLGGVQTTAPHATSGWHCWDESDRMCYNDGSGVAMQQICPTSHENVFDCNHDDYYYAGSPPSGTYLASHWNTANSVFLATQAGSGGGGTTPPPATTPTPPQSLVATRAANGKGINLKWLAPTSNGGSAVTGYDVYRHDATTGTYSLLTTLGVVTNWRDRTTTSKKVYWYEVTAVNAVGQSAPSNEASATAR